MAYTEFLKKHKEKGTTLKVFLSSNKTMLTGSITDFDQDCIVLDKCMILKEQIISISPE
jgi:sRNA-binding regulator protein Hfq